MRAPPPLTAAEFAAARGVSRETLRRLEAYVELLRRWQERINLVGADSLADVWRRHILDSAQLADCAPSAPGPWFDLGSGAGLPGLVLAICGRANMHLVESDRRKAVFLREAARHTDTAVTIHAERIAALDERPAAVISARALAPLAKLFALAAPLTTLETVLILPKGQHVDDELTEAAKSWTMQVTRHQSLSDPRGIILRISGLARKERR